MGGQCTLGVCASTCVHGAGARVCAAGTLPGGGTTPQGPSFCLSSFPNWLLAFPLSHSLLHQFSLGGVSMVF